MSCERGSFILFEGIDRSGKSTQVLLLSEHLRGRGVQVEVICFPDRNTEVGKLIDRYLQSKCEVDDRSLHLLFSANRWERCAHIRETLNRGVTVIMDRYTESGIAYSMAKGLPYDWCKSCDDGLPRPDLIIYCDLSIEEAIKRGGFGAERFDRVDYQTKVRAAYQQLVIQSEERDLHKQLTSKSEERDVHNQLIIHSEERMEYKELITQSEEKWFIVDASLSADEMHRLIRTIASQLIQ